MASQRQKKARSKTFTGCWTCRGRHIKCDERRPSCSQCLKAKVKCGAYGVRLFWDHSRATVTNERLTTSTKGKSSASASSDTPIRAKLKDPVGLIAMEGVLDHPFPASALGHSLTSCSQTLPIQPTLQQIGNPFPVKQRFSMNRPLSLPIRLQPYICSAPQLKLLHHWRVFLCDASVPVPGVNNPLRDFLMPMSLEGAQSPGHTSSGSTALRHAICAASAAHLAVVQSDNVQLHKLNFEHSELYLANLRNALSQNMPGDRPTILATLIMCLMIESMTGRPSNWRIHVAGACGWLSQIETRYWNKSTITRTLYQLFLGMIVFAQSRSGSPSRSLGIEPLNLDCIKEDYMLENLVGIPYIVLKLVSDANRGFSKSFSAMDDQLDMDMVETELYLSFPKPVSHQLGEEQRFLIRHQSQSAYYAGLIFFKRTRRKVPLGELQDFVLKGSEELFALDTTNKLCSPLIWPVAILAFEANDKTIQRRMWAWLTAEIRSCFHSWQALAQLAAKVWRTRARDLRQGQVLESTWQDILEGERDLDILFT